jgi:hypothetical protein
MLQEMVVLAEGMCVLSVLVTTFERTVARTFQYEGRVRKNTDTLKEECHLNIYH